MKKTLSNHVWEIVVDSNEQWMEVAKLIEQIDPTIRFFGGEKPTEWNLYTDPNTKRLWNTIVFGFEGRALQNARPSGADVPSYGVRYSIQGLRQFLPPTIDERKDQLRAKFALKYPDIAQINQTDIHHLIYLIDKELDKHYTNGHLRMYMEPMDRFTARMIRTKTLKYKGLELTVCAHYFTKRQAIEFTKDGKVYFCGWASGINHDPFLNAFEQWLEDK